MTSSTVLKAQKKFTEKPLDFKNIRFNGYRFDIGSWLVVYWIKNDLKKVRIVWNLNRKIGSAPIRNRMKRWSREFLRKNLNDITKNHGLDFNFAFKTNVEKVFYKDLRHGDFDSDLKNLEKRIRKSI